MNQLEDQPMGDADKNANNSSVLFDRLIDKYNAEEKFQTSSEQLNTTREDPFKLHRIL